MIRNDLHRIYKQESGLNVNHKEVGLRRTRGQWLLDPDELGAVDDDYVFENLGYYCKIWFPDTDYINWLENKLMEFF